MKKSILLLLTLSSQTLLAGPVCDSLSQIQSQVLSCNSRLTNLQNDNYRLSQEIKSISQDMNSGRILRDTNSCQASVKQTKSDSQQLADDLAQVKLQVDGVQSQLHLESRGLDAMTAFWQCAGMDRKNAITYIVSGRTQAEAMRNLENPPTANLDAVGLQERQTFLDMKRKHGIHSYCFRGFNGDGQDPVVDITPLPGGGGTDIGPVGPVGPGPGGQGGPGDTVPGDDFGGGSFGGGNSDVTPGVDPV